MSDQSTAHTERRCDHCGDRPTPDQSGLLGTYGGANDPFDYLCIRHWRAFERGDIRSIGTDTEHSAEASDDC